MPTKNLNGSKGGAADPDSGGDRTAKPRFVRFTFPRNPSDDVSGRTTTITIVRTGRSTGKPRTNG